MALPQSRPQPDHRTSCRFCGTALSKSFVDLGIQPPANYYVRPEDAGKAERFYPLHAYVCESCLLVQLEEFQTPDELFGDYAYFSSYSESWVRHAERYAEAMMKRLGLGARSLVVEVASNDGYLLQHFKKRGVPVLGVEPAANVAEVAETKGIPSLVRFFGVETATEMVAAGQGADLLVGNNVLAHVPDLNDFVAGMAILLKPEGTLTMEFPHLLQLVANVQFDTIYHEHFSYFSLHTVEKVFARHGIELFDVEELSTHGGSLRIFGRHKAPNGIKANGAIGTAIGAVKAKERAAGLDRVDGYKGFAETVARTKRALLSFLIEAKAEGKRVVGYGAPAKGNTLLNYCGVRTDFLDYTVDASPHKQGLMLPGTRIPIFAPERIFQTRPDYVLILPWNIADEITKQMSGIRAWGGKFVVPIPEVRVIG
ncbi:MAG: methyltransferase domain-containing protein [Gemmatimonas sp.]